MSARGFVVLLLVTVLAALGAVFAAVQPTLSGADRVAGEPMFPGLGQQIGRVGKITVETPQYSISWEQRDGAWVSPERGDYPARKATVSDLVLGLARMTKVEAKTAQPEWYQHIRVGDPGANPPTGVAHVTVTSTDGATLADAILGARSYSIPASHTRGGMFVREADGTQSWLVEGVVTVPAGLPEWFETILDIPGSAVADIAILSGDRRVVEFRKTDATNGTYEIAYRDPAELADNDIANSNTLRSLASAIVGVRAENVRDADTLSPVENARTNRFTTTSGLQLDITVFEQDGGRWVVVKASAPEGSEAAATAAEINGRTANWAFQLAASHASRLTQPVANLVQKPSAPPAESVAPIPFDQNGRPILGPQGFNVPGAIPAF